MSPRVFVCFGTGGVGKTTVSAALGLALARAGSRTLVVTCDPARRLADAFGVQAALEPVPVDAEGRLWCFMPEARESARLSVALLFGDDPRRLAALAQNPVLSVLLSGLAGVHELGALAQIVARSPDYDAIVVDTAPTRHALSLVQLPDRVARLVDSRALRWLSGVSKRRLSASAGATKQPTLSRLFDWGEARLVAELEGSLGGAPIAACMELVSAGMDARPALLVIAKAARELLTGERTTYVFVAAPRSGAVDDVAFFHEELHALTQRPSLCLVLNRCLEQRPTWSARLSGHRLAAQCLRDAARLAEDEFAALVQQTRQTRQALVARFPHVLLACVPRLDASSPRAVAEAAAAVLARVIDVSGGARRATA